MLEDAMIFHGEVIGIRDIVTFQGKSVKKLEKACKDSVDDTLSSVEKGENSLISPLQANSW